VRIRRKESNKGQQNERKISLFLIIVVVAIVTVPALEGSSAYLEARVKYYDCSLQRCDVTWSGGRLPAVGRNIQPLFTG
jgi:hypothetical protein